MSSVLFLAILAGNIAALHSDYSNSSFRRLSLQVSGYTHYPFLFENGGCCVASDCSSKQCNRVVTVSLNNVTVCIRRMTERFTDVNGEFICRVEITNNHTHLQSVFTSNVTLAVNVSTQDGKLFFIKTIYHGQMSPGLTSQGRDSLGYGASIDYSMSYICVGYVGYNCKYKCDISDSKSDCDWDTGVKRCLNGNIDTSKCEDRPKHLCELANPCKNESKCNQISLSQYSCSCKPGFIGINCSIFTCETPCDPLRGKCVGPNKCECFDGYEGTDCTSSSCSSNTYCKNDGMCFETNGLTYCSCDTMQYAGLRCEYKCSPMCMFGQCFHSENKTYCLCDEGFKGQMCEELIPVDLSILSSVLSRRTKRKIVAAVTAGVILVGILAISLSMVKRRRMMKSYELMTRTEAVYKTITRNTATLQA